MVEGSKCLCAVEHLCAEGVCRGGACGCLVGNVYIDLSFGVNFEWGSVAVRV